MERQTFVLTQTKDYRRSVRIFLKDGDNKIDDRRVKFTTEHKVSEKDRNQNARKIAAEFSTSDERLYDAMLRDTGYGVTYVLKDDPKGEMKKEPFNITPLDAKKSALKNLFEQVGIEFDSNKSNDVLEQEYQIIANAKAGTNITGSGPGKIDIKPVNVEKELLDRVNAARELYKAKYKEEIPDEYKNDMALLSALSDPNFDAKGYMGKPGDKDGDPEESIEVLQNKYFEKFGYNVANAKKNDAAWIKNKLTE